MGYKLLGFIIWQGAKFYIRGRYPGAARKAAIVALAGGVIVGGVAVAHAARSDRD